MTTRRSSVHDTTDRHTTAHLVIFLATLLCCCGMLQSDALAQNFRQAGAEFNAMRKLTVPAPSEKKPSNCTIATAEFYHHGEINPEGTNLVVLSGKTHKPVAARVLQLGPGDFCRVAFEVEPGVFSYDLYYGGEVPTDDIPQWSRKAGLLLETRAMRDCNLNAVDSVRSAYEASSRIGSDYVDGVHHSTNPFTMSSAPFLTRYSGTIRIPNGGKYAFYTSSQDASFLLIDGKQVAAAPGRHQPLRRATPGMLKPVQLTAGPHQFEYYHAATGSEALMTAAWEPNPSGDNPKPQAIPKELFGVNAIGKATVGTLARPDAPATADFISRISGDVPLPDNPKHLVGVQFHCTTPSAVSSGAQINWDFGDGQVSSELNPDHVYLKPGIYPVTFTLKRGAKVHEVTNRVEVDLPFVGSKDKPHELAMYIPMLDTYDPARLDADSLLQLVAAYLFRADQLIEQADLLKQQKEEEAFAAQDPEFQAREQSIDVNQKQKDPKTLLDEALAYQARAVAVGKMPLVGQSTVDDKKTLYELAVLLGPIARNTLGDSPTAGKIWHGAAKLLPDDKQAAECEAEAADIAMNDLLNLQAGKALLDAAQKRLGSVKYGTAAAKIQRILGDYYAATGDGEPARAAYRKADEVSNARMMMFERTAWQGAHSRSVEQFLQSGELGRAADELRQWEVNFPTDRIEGYMSLMYAKYWQQRKLYPQAVAMADRLLVINPESPYIDQILITSVECDLARGQKDRAVATLTGLIRDYPGSPQIPRAKQMLETIEP